MITVMSGQRTVELPDARHRGGDLWLSPDDVDRATGWQLKPEGMCKGEICVPIPRGREAQFVTDGRVNVARFWQHMGHPVVHDAAGSAWVLGTSAAERRSTLDTLDAPDFELPDLAGKRHRLSQHRGRKVLLATWASW